MAEMMIGSGARSAPRPAALDARSWGLAPVFALLAGLLWPGQASLAQTGQAPAPALYKVKGVKVDVTAESAVAAREQAMTQAFTQALGIIEARLVTSSALAKVPRTNAQQLLKDFEVTEEKVSPTRYIGTLTVRFDPNKVRRFLWSAGVRFNDTASDPVLVLPVYEADGAPVLFEASNPWLAAWTALPAEPRVVPFVVPSGELDDLKAISATQALGADAQALQAIAGRYNVQGILVADAAPASIEGNAGLNIRLLRIEPDGSSKDAWDVKGEAGEDAAALLDRAVASVVTRVTDAWKSGAPQGPEHTLIANVGVTSLADWIALRKRIEAVKSVRSVQVNSLSPSQARVVLHYFGEPEALMADLAASGFTMTPAPAGVEGWVIAEQGSGTAVLSGAPGESGVYAGQGSTISAPAGGFNVQTFPASQEPHSQESGPPGAASSSPRPSYP